MKLWVLFKNNKPFRVEFKKSRLNMSGYKYNEEVEKNGKWVDGKFTRGWKNKRPKYILMGTHVPQPVFVPGKKKSNWRIKSYEVDSK